MFVEVIVEAVEKEMQLAIMRPIASKLDSLMLVMVTPNLPLVLL